MNSRSAMCGCSTTSPTVKSAVVGHPFFWQASMISCLVNSMVHCSINE